MAETVDQKNWDDLFREQIPNALRLAIRLTGNAHDAEDIVQESLLRAVRARDSFRDECSLRTWISRIVVNVVRSWSVGIRRAESLSLDPVDDTQSQERWLEQAQREELIARHVSELPARQREVLVLCFFEEMTAVDVAELLGVSVQNVYSNLSAAKQQLRESLACFMKSGAES